MTSNTTLPAAFIEEHSDKMHAMAKALLDWETIDSEQLDDIMAGKEPRPPKDWTPALPPRAVMGLEAEPRRSGRHGTHRSLIGY